MEDSVKLEIQEKSVFERAIIEAFKQFKVSDVYEKLSIAYSELPLYITEIKKENTQEKNKRFILNLNIIDKIGRIMERNYVNNNDPNKKKNIHEKEEDEMDEKIESEIMVKNPGVKFSDIIGMKEMKNILYEIIVVPTIRPDLFTGIRKPQRGILFLELN